MVRKIREASPRFRARLACVFYLTAVLSSIFVESFVRGRLLYAAGLIPVASFAVLTLLFRKILKPVNGNLAWLSALFNLIRPHAGGLRPEFDLPVARLAQSSGSSTVPRFDAGVYSDRV